MKREVIKYLGNCLPDNQWCRSDFKRDVERLEKLPDDTQFFWLGYNNSRGSGTVLVVLDEDSWYETEAGRLAMFRDFKFPIRNMAYFGGENGDFHYYDGKEIGEIYYAEFQEIYRDLCSPEYERQKRLHTAEYEARNKPLELVYSDDAIKALVADEAFAREMGDTSLMECLETLRRYARMALDHKVYITPDIDARCYNFSERINGRPQIYGGIIYHGSPKEGYRENNACQLTPSYGWQIHT